MMLLMGYQAVIADTAARWAAGVADALLPRHCLLCGEPSGPGPLCAGCLDDLPRLGRACAVCALPLPRAEGPAAPGPPVCGRCVIRPPPWDAAVAALQFAFPADDLVRRCKFGRDLCAGAALAEALSGAVREAGLPRPGAIVPVPLHRARFHARTFNQAELLAQALGRALALPVQARTLLRRRRTVAQSGLDARARAQNVRGAFALRRRTARDALPRHVALVDDVLTTGVTLSECSRVLKRGGVRRVTVYVAARAP